MAYSPTYPAIRVERLGEVADAGVQPDTCKNEWTYVTTDSLVTVEGAGYFPLPASGGPNFGRGDKLVVLANIATGNPLTGGPAQLQEYAVYNGPLSGDAATIIVGTQGRSQAGSSQGVVGSSGNLPPQVAPTSAGLTPSATGADKTVTFLTIPANAFDVSGRQLYLQAIGGFAANGNNKNAKLWISNTLTVIGNTIASATKIADLGTLATNGQGWVLEAQVIKYGVNGSNTQFGLHLPSLPGANGLIVPTALTLTENATIYAALTINNATAASDAYANALIGTWSN